MIVLAQIAFAVFSAIGVYAAAVLLWWLGCYLAVFPSSGKPYDFAGMLLPPVVLPLIYLVWLAALRFHPRFPLHPWRRLIQLAIAAGASVLFSSAQMVWGVGSNSGPAAVAAVLMTSISAITLLFDRDLNTALLIALIALATIVPVVLAGRVLSVAVGMAVWSVIRMASSAIRSLHLH